MTASMRMRRKRRIGWPKPPSGDETRHPSTAALRNPASAMRGVREKRPQRRCPLSRPAAPARIGLRGAAASRMFVLCPGCISWGICVQSCDFRVIALPCRAEGGTNALRRLRARHEAAAHGGSRNRPGGNLSAPFSRNQRNGQPGRILGLGWLSLGYPRRFFSASECGEPRCV